MIRSTPASAGVSNAKWMLQLSDNEKAPLDFSWGAFSLGNLIAYLRPLFEIEKGFFAERSEIGLRTDGANDVFIGSGFADVACARWRCVEGVTGPECRGTKCRSLLPIRSERPMRCSASRRIGQFCGSW